MRNLLFWEVFVFLFPFLGSTTDIDPCVSYQELRESHRSQFFKIPALGVAHCDGKLKTAWYRFKGKAGLKMPEKCVSSSSCGTHAPGWFNGSHPIVPGEVSSGQVCFNWIGSCCQWPTSVRVKNCDWFYIYELPKTPLCELQYCGDGAKDPDCATDNNDITIDGSVPGVLVNPKFSDPARLHCTWRISVPSGMKVRLTMTNITLGSNDYIVLLDGLQDNSKELARFADSESAVIQVDSIDRYLLVSFVSNGSSTGSVFRLEYTGVYQETTTSATTTHPSTVTTTKEETKKTTPATSEAPSVTTSKTGNCDCERSSTSLVNKSCDTVTDIDPCVSYQELRESYRSQFFKISALDVAHCDGKLKTAWYRFKGKAGLKMPEKCVSSNSCGTHAPGWFNGSHPIVPGKVSSGQVCFNWIGSCCQWSTSVRVKNCDWFYIYELPKTPLCELQYCGDGAKETKETTSITSQPPSVTTPKQETKKTTTASSEAPSVTTTKQETKETTTTSQPLSVTTPKQENTEKTTSSQKPSTVTTGQQVNSSIDVTCDKNEINVILQLGSSQDYIPESVGLNDASCKPSFQNRTHIFFKSTLEDCGTMSYESMDGKMIVYHNAIHLDVKSKRVIGFPFTRDHQAVFEFQCRFKKRAVLSSILFDQAAVSKLLVITDIQSFGNFTFEMKMFKSGLFKEPYTDYPVGPMDLGSKLFLQVSVKSNDSGLVVLAEECKGTPSPEYDDDVHYTFIEDGCSKDSTLQYNYTLSAFQRFSLSAFNFRLIKSSEIFLHCKLKACLRSDPKSRCAEGCPFGKRKKRDLQNQVDRLLAIGPIVFSQKHNEELIKKTENEAPAKAEDDNVAFAVVAGVLGFIALLLLAALLSIFKSRGTQESNGVNVHLVRDGEPEYG